MVFPAHAGMIPLTPHGSNNQASVPRTCGDDPTAYRVGAVHDGCSPHMRG